ncbi:hypothetical protein BH23BAC4_BH23BAC4_15750 [soil metagenome]
MRYTYFFGFILIGTVLGCNQNADVRPVSLAAVDVVTAQAALLPFFQSVLTDGAGIEQLVQGESHLSHDGRHVLIAKAVTSSGRTFGVGVTFSGEITTQSVSLEYQGREYIMSDPTHFTCDGGCDCEMRWHIDAGTMSCNCNDGGNLCTFTVSTGPCGEGLCEEENGG